MKNNCKIQILPKGFRLRFEDISSNELYEIFALVEMTQGIWIETVERISNTPITLVYGGFSGRVADRKGLIKELIGILK